MPRNTTRRSNKTPQMRSNPQPTPQPYQPQQSTFGDAVKSGIGLGIGMEAVRGVTGAVFGGSNNQTVNNIPASASANVTEPKCKLQHDELMLCLKNNNFDCKYLFTQYNTCLENTLG